MMAKVKQHIQSPLLHRLTDVAPDEVFENEQERYLEFADLRRDIQQNLEWILNTRNSMLEQGQLPVSLRESILHYGIADFSQQYYSIKKNQKALCQSIQDTITHFEPRLQQVSVELISTDAAISRQFSFRIVGTVHLKPEPQQATFEPNMDVLRYQFSFEDSSL